MWKEETKRNAAIVLIAAAAALMVWLPQVGRAASMGTAFTYQGRLVDGNEAAEGEYDLQFRLYDDPCDGNQVGSDVNKPEVDVIDGYFTVELDFGARVFDGDARWLGIGVRPGDMNDPNVYTTLSPRQEVTPAPYALYAGRDGDWKVSDNDMYPIPSGNVGIGTTSPASELDVVGNIAVSGTVDGVDVSSHAASANAHHVPPTTLPPSGSAGGDLSGSYPNPSVVNDSHSHGNATVSDNISINNTRLYAPTGAGNVGIGTTSPLSKLSVGGNGLANTGVYGSGGNVGVHGSAFVGVQGFGEGVGVHGKSDTGSFGYLGYNTFGGYFSGDGYFSGNVGIGTASPGAGLHLKGTGYPNSFMHLQSDANEATGFRLYEGTTVKWHIFNDWENDGLRIYNSDGSGTVFFAEQSTGNVGIGTTTPTEKLQVAGNIKATGSRISFGTAEYIEDAGSNLISTGSSSLHVGGNVGIGTTSPSTELEVAGTARVDVIQIMGADVAEKFPVSEEVKPGMVVAIDLKHPGKLCLGRGSYNRCVAGIVSGAGDLQCGAVLGHSPENEDAPAIALTGRVWTYCDATNQPIEPGDLLTTSDMAGHAMKVTDYTRAQGAILGKAMTTLEDGQGLVLVLVSLQ